MGLSFCETNIIILMMSDGRSAIIIAFSNEIILASTLVVIIGKPNPVNPCKIAARIKVTVIMMWVIVMNRLRESIKGGKVSVTTS